MITIDTWEGLEAALASPLAPAAKAILTATNDRLEDFNDQPLNELCKILIVEPHDQFVLEPPWEYVAYTGGWLEAVAVTGDDGFGLVVLVEDRPDGDQALLGILRAHTT